MDDDRDFPEAAEHIRLDDIETDHGGHWRARDQKAVGRYSNRLLDDPNFEMHPGEAYQDLDGKVWLFHGAHRLAAYRIAGRQSMPLYIWPGTKDDARRDSFKPLNATNGVPETTEVRIQRLKEALADEVVMADNPSNASLAKMLGVDDKTIAKYRPKPTSENPRSRKGADGREYKPSPKKPTPTPAVKKAKAAEKVAKQKAKLAEAEAEAEAAGVDPAEVKPAEQKPKVEKPPADPPGDAPPWEQYNADLEQLAKDIESLAREAIRIAKFAKGGDAGNEYARGIFDFDGSVTELRRVKRLCLDSRIAEKRGDRYVSVSEAQLQGKLAKGRSGRAA
ncbi:MAG: hypothetical protein AAF916_04240 [Planctomycetota bacterium]